MKIKIISITDSEKHFKDCINEYTKRLGKEVELINIKPFKGNNINQIKENETNKIVEILKKLNGYKVLLSIQGIQIDSIEFKEIIERNNYEIIYIVGGPYGLNEDNIEKIINLKISFGNITLPHGLCKLTLIEQIYRTKTILENKKYHY